MRRTPLVRAVALLAVTPALLAAQTVTGRVVDSVTHRPLAHVPVHLVPGPNAARDTVYAAAETATDGVFVLTAPAPGTYRVRLAGTYLGPPLTLATADTTDEHEYAVGPLRAPEDTSQYHVLRGAELDAVLRSGRPLLECQVEKKAATVPGTLLPEYPREIRVDGRGRSTAGSVLAQFVIDTTGHAERATIQTWRTRDTDDAFAAAAITGIVAARFTPGQGGGHKVRQLVHVPMTFQLNDGPVPPKIQVTGCAPVGGRLLPAAIRVPAAATH